VARRTCPPAEPCAGPYVSVHPRTRPEQTKRVRTIRDRQAIFRDAVDFIGDAEPDDLKLEIIARRIATSKRHLQRVFFEIAGLSFRAYLLHERLLRGKQLLELGQSPSAVARVLGYSTASHFGRAFKRHHGVTPGIWQAEQRERAPMSPERCAAALYAALQHRNILALGELVAADAEWEVAMPGAGSRLLTGRGSVLAWLSVPPPSHVVLEVDTFVARRAGGVDVEGAHVHADSARSVSNRIAFRHELTVVDGRIMRLREILPDGLLAQAALRSFAAPEE
jgi:AraC family transcriptional regulator, regulatory protein of adaptative response / methylphosphotriester-DNA alkyltransferase methyltransferase